MAQAMRVPTIFTAVDRFSSVVSRMTAGVSAFGKTAQASAMRSSRALNAAGTSFLHSGAAIGVGIGLAVNEAGKFEKAMSNVSTLTKNTPEEMKVMGKSVMEMGRVIQKPLSELTEGLYDVVSAGIESSQQLRVLKASGVLAVAGLGTTKEAVNITTSALNAFGAEAGTAEEVTNKLMKTVLFGKTTVSGIAESFGTFASIMKNSNVSLDEYLASASALTTTGMSMSRAQTQVSSATLALIKPNKKMEEIYARLGERSTTIIKNSGGLVGALKKVKTQAEIMGLDLAKVMGRKEGLSAILALLGSQEGKFKQIMEDMASGSDTIGDAFAKQSKTFASGFQLMKNKLTILGIVIGEQLMPRITELITSVSGTIEGIGKWAENNKALSGTLLTMAIWLLKVGVALKVLSFLYLGFARILGIVTAVSAFYSNAMIFAALSGEGFAASLWLIASGLWANLFPILLVVAALGLLAYGFSSLSSSGDDMVNKQMSSLSKGNAAWVNSTSVMTDEIRKQKRLMETNNPDVNNTASGKSIAAIIKKNKEVKVAETARIAAIKMPEFNRSAALYNTDGSAIVRENSKLSSLYKAPAEKINNKPDTVDTNSIMSAIGGNISLDLLFNGKQNSTIQSPFDGTIPVNLGSTLQNN